MHVHASRHLFRYGQFQLEKKHCGRTDGRKLFGIMGLYFWKQNRHLELRLAFPYCNCGDRVKCYVRVIDDTRPRFPPRFPLLKVKAQQYTQKAVFASNEINLLRYFLFYRRSRKYYFATRHAVAVRSVLWVDTCAHAFTHCD